MVRFDSKALYAAIDAKHYRNNLTWKQVADEVGISQTTIRRTATGGRMEVDGMLAMVAWLEVKVEIFCRNK